MNILRTRKRLASTALAAVGLVLVVGCSDDSGLPKRYPVSGTVKYNGEVVSKGTITFMPSEAGGRTAGGDIENGRYSLSTTGAPRDGALPGSYKVSVTALDFDTTALKAIAKGGQFHHDKAFAGAVKSAKKLVPAKYNVPETSNLTAEVKSTSNTLDFDLHD